MNQPIVRLGRRQFLATAAGAALAPYFVPSRVLGAPDSPSANDRLTVAHIGVGGMGVAVGTSVAVGVGEGGSEVSVGTGDGGSVAAGAEVQAEIRRTINAETMSFCISILASFCFLLVVIVAFFKAAFNKQDQRSLYHRWWAKNGNWRRPEAEESFRF